MFKSPRGFERPGASAWRKHNVFLWIIFLQEMLGVWALSGGPEKAGIGARARGPRAQARSRGGRVP
eukprot:2426864-Pyramimonas_sp.AAC.1